MKKILAIILCIAMVAAIALTGCGGGSSSSSSSSSSTSKNDKAGNVATVITSALGDKSFSDSCWKGMNKIKDTYGVEIAYFEMKQDQTKAIPALTDYAESGKYDIIISGTYSTVENTQAVIKDFPNQKFIHYDANIQATKDNANNSFANAYSMSYLQNEGSYLVGFIASKATKTGVIAELGGGQIDVIYDFMYGFLEGAKYGKSDIKVVSSFIGDWENINKAKDLAKDAMGKKADVLFHIAGGAGQGMFEACAEKGDVWGIGVDADQWSEYNDAKKTDIANIILTSMIKDVGTTIFDAYVKNLDGKLAWGKHESLGVKENAVGPAETGNYSKVVTGDVKTQYEAMKKDVIDGKIKIGSAFGKTQDEQNALLNSFRP